MAQDQKGIAIGDNRKDYSGRINANFNLLNDLLEIGLHTEYREAHRDQRSSSSCFDMALKMNPTEHVYDSTSETGYNVLVGGSEYYNPLAEVMLKQTDNVDKWLKADATVKLNLPAGFSAQATLGWEDRQYQQTHYVSALHRTSLNGSYKGKDFTDIVKQSMFLLNLPLISCVFLQMTIQSVRWPDIAIGKTILKILICLTTISLWME